MMLIAQQPDGTTTATRRRGPCVHLGSARKCCSELFLCRQTPGTSCVLAGYPSDEVRCCDTCEHWQPRYPIAPARGRGFEDRPWYGDWPRKVWDFAVTVAIPVCDAAEACGVIVDLMRLQTERPCIMLIDTGSTPEQLAALQQLAAEDVEVHSLRFNGVRHPSDFPAVAMDLAFSGCRTPYLLATHADCFLTGRDVVRDLLDLCRDGNPVVGYELTPRDHSDWPGMVGHTLTMFDVAAMDRINAGWSLRRLVNQYEHPDGRPTDHDISPATSPNWPDTEILINYQLREAGITPLIIGQEANAARTTDHRIDHCRSLISSQLYAAGSPYCTAVSGWLQDGLAKARERVRLWAAESAEHLL